MPSVETPERLTKEQLTAMLEDKMANINETVSQIKEEVTGSSRRIKVMVEQNPMAALVATVAAGAILGLLLSGNKKKSKQSHFIETVTEEIGEQMASAGHTNVQPVVVYVQSSESKGEKKSSLIGTVAKMIGKKAVSMGVAYATEYIQENLLDQS